MTTRHGSEMHQIDHIVYVMFENRSFDNVLGWLYESDEPQHFIGGSGPFSFDGLDATRDFNEDEYGVRHFVVKGTGRSFAVPSFDPQEAFEHVTSQLYGTDLLPLRGTEATMGGFYRDYAAWFDRADEIMETFAPEELPILSGLAREYAVSDRYFSSVPTQTNSNRAFAAAGNSLGETDAGTLGAWVNNRNSGLLQLGRPHGRQFNQRSMFRLLSDQGRDDPSDWMIFNSNGSWWEDAIGGQGYQYTRTIMEDIHDARFDAHFSTVGDPAAPLADTLFGRIASGRLPALTFVEPKWGLGLGRLRIGSQGSDYHPPFDVRPGETLLKSLYDALTADAKLWNRTLLVVNFDEHGGTYDHVPPPWTATPPWEGDHGTPRPEGCEAGFEFDRFGVRVPLIVASPWIPRSTLFRASGEIPFDHTSVIATVLQLMGVPREEWQLGARVANAPTFETVLAEVLRPDIPPIERL